MAIVGKLTLTEVSRAVRDTFVNSMSGVVGQALEEMTESIPDTPLVQVYFESIRTPQEQVKQKTFGGVVQQLILTMHADVFSSTRSHIGEDMLKATQKADEVITLLQAQMVQPHFGVEGLRSFGWRAERANIEYGKQNLMGVRFVLEFMIF